MKKERQSNIELLRMLAIMGVVILHYNNQYFGAAFELVQPETVNYYILSVLESLSICAVDLFILISGFFMCRTEKRTWSKPIELIVQVAIFSGALYLLDCKLGVQVFAAKDFIYSLILNNYFVTLYIVLYLVSPYINMLFQMLDDNKQKHLLLILIGVFSVWPTAVDVWNKISGQSWNGLSPISMYGNQWGYTIVNFVLLYLVGMYLAYNGKEKLKTSYLLLLLLACVAGLTVWSLYDSSTAWEYCNPVIIAEAVILFSLFRRIPMKTHKWLNSLARASFTVYLLHTAFFPYLRIEAFVNGNPVLLILHILVSVVAIYIICWIVHLIYSIARSMVVKIER